MTLTVPADMTAVGRAASGRGARVGFALGAVAAVALLAVATLRPAGIAICDAGGFETMLRQFLQTGRLDFMHWCQPTFAGMLPVALGWTACFGDSTDSLNMLGAGHIVLLALAVYMLAVRHTKPAAACVVAMAVPAFWEVLATGPGFMTDVPYAAYVGVLMVLLDRLVADGKSPAGGGAWTKGQWTTFGLFLAAFVLAVATRPFAAVVIGAFFILMLARRRERGMWLLLGGASVLALAVVLGAVAAISVNRIPALEQTVLPALARHEWARLELRAMALAFLYTSGTALPVLLLIPAVRQLRVRWWDVVAGGAGLVLALHFWRKGVLAEAALLPDVMRVVPGLLWVQIVLAPLASAAFLRAVLAGVGVPVGVVLVLMIAAQFAAMPIMPHPLIRHALPAYVGLLLLAGLMAAASRGQVAATMMVVLALAGVHAASASRARAVEAAVWRSADALVAAGTPHEQIFAGWAWFCKYQLSPGERDYVQHYHDLETHARFQVRTLGDGTASVVDVSMPFPSVSN